MTDSSNHFRYFESSIANSTDEPGAISDYSDRYGYFSPPKPDSRDVPGSNISRFTGLSGSTPKETYDPVAHGLTQFTRYKPFLLDSDDDTDVQSHLTASLDLPQREQFGLPYYRFPSPAPYGSPYDRSPPPAPYGSPYDRSPSPELHGSMYRQSTHPERFRSNEPPGGRPATPRNISSSKTSQPGVDEAEAPIPHPFFPPQFDCPSKGCHRKGELGFFFSANVWNHWEICHGLDALPPPVEFLQHAKGLEATDIIPKTMASTSALETQERRDPKMRDETALQTARDEDLGRMGLETFHENHLKRPADERPGDTQGNNTVMKIARTSSPAIALPLWQEIEMRKDRKYRDENERCQKRRYLEILHDDRMIQDDSAHEVVGSTPSPKQDEFGDVDEISTRPRLTKEQVEMLESQFQTNHKPNSQVKRQLAIQTKLTLPRVANWFQNRRARAKQQKKQEEFEAQQMARHEHRTLTVAMDFHSAEEEQNNIDQITRSEGGDNGSDSPGLFQQISLSASPAVGSDGESSFVLDTDPLVPYNAKDVQLLGAMFSYDGSDIAEDFIEKASQSMTQRPNSADKYKSSSRAACTKRAATRDSASSGNGGRSTSKPTDYPLENSEDETPLSKRPRTDRKKSELDEPPALLACPFAKFDAERYSERNTNDSEQKYRRCSSAVLKDIPKLKQHLYRVHRRPEFYCRSCFEHFETDNDLEQHVRIRMCQIIDCPFTEKMSQDQFNAVKRRKPNERRVDAWFGIFKILFPNAPLPDNPYVACPTALPGFQVSRTIEEYNQFITIEASRTLAPLLTQELIGDCELVMEHFVGQVLERTLPLVLHRLGEVFQKSEDTRQGVEVGGSRAAVTAPLGQELLDVQGSRVGEL